MNAYHDLELRFKRILAVRESAAMLEWDMQTLMPEGGMSARSEQLATLAVVAHDLITDPRIEENLDTAESDKERLDAWQQANLREMRRTWIHSAALPGDLVEEISRASQACEQVWRQARPANDFKRVLPSLSHLAQLKKQAAEIKAKHLNMEPYDAVLDFFEAGIPSTRIDAIFDDLAAFIKQILPRILEKQARNDPPKDLQGDFSVPTQTALLRRLMEAVGFDFMHGRLDVTLHPFCGGAPDDVRITTRFDTGDFMKAVMNTLHETGHAMYERGLPKEWRYQPVGSSAGYGVHESQSLLVEMQAVRSRAFVNYLLPLAKDMLGGHGAGWSEDNLVATLQQVKPSLIRVEADEVTYPAHIILRYRLEKAYMSGQLDLADLPDAWSAGMQELLGITPPDDRRGCLQDIHWFVGEWGYFPSYTLGALMAAQLFAQLRRDVANVDENLADGNFSPIMAWLREKVHSKGALYKADDLMQDVTGVALSPKFFKDHIQSRYLNS